jgi:hypothetical protein
VKMETAKKKRNGSQLLAVVPDALMMIILCVEVEE